MGAISSINFKKSNAIQIRHNDRDLKPNYLISDDGCEVNRNNREALKLRNQIIKNAIETYTKNTKQKFQAKSYEWSAVCNIKEDTTMQDLERLAEHFEQKYGFQCYQIAIHRDEGHFDDNGEKVINHHAHLEFVTLDKNTGKSMFRAELQRAKALSKIQTEVAEILQMQRGEDKQNSKRERIEPRKYAQLKEQERKNTQKLKQDIKTKDNVIQTLNQELEQEKLSKAELKKELEQLRKDSKNQGYSKEFFQEINLEKKKLRFKNKLEFFNWVEELRERHTKKNFLSSQLDSEAFFEDMYKVYQEQDNIIQTQDQEIQALKAENNEIKAQKHTLTQEQIQEIINQALAQKEAEIEKIKKEAREREAQKNQEIQALKANKQRFNELLEQDPALNKAYNQALEALKNREKTPNNEELTENNRKQATYFLNNFFKDDEPLFSINSDKIEHSEQDQKNHDDLGIDKILIHKNEDKTQEDNKPKIRKHR